MVNGEPMDGNKTVRAAFTELAPRYEQAMDQELGGFLSKSYDEFIDRLLEFAPIQADDLVLDVATGTTRIPRELVDRSRVTGGIVGLDITPAMLEHAQSSCSVDRYTEGIHLVCASGSAMASAAGGACAQAELQAVSKMHTGDEWHALLSGTGFTKIEVREERARRAWYPHVLAIKAVAGQAGPGDWNTRVQGYQNSVESS